MSFLTFKQIKTLFYGNVHTLSFTSMNLCVYTYIYNTENNYNIRVRAYIGIITFYAWLSFQGLNICQC